LGKEMYNANVVVVDNSAQTKGQRKGWKGVAER
jgi:hypothetical protein